MKKNILTVQDMIALEIRLASMNLNELFKDISMTQSDIAEKLKLKVCFVSASELSKDTRATLSPPPAGSEFNGIIKILKTNTSSDSNFSYMHEIAHYIFDVGVDKVVDKEYTSKVKGKTETKEEQETNYLAAAILIPLKNIIDDLKEYDNNRRTTDEIKFVQNLTKKYNVGLTAMFRRIREARQLCQHGYSL